MRNDLPALGDIAPTHIICGTCDGVATLVSVFKIPQRLRRHFIETTSPHPRQLVEDGMAPLGGAPACWAGAEDPPGSCQDRAADLDRGVSWVAREYPSTGTGT